MLAIGDDRSRRSRALRDPGVLLDLARGREDFRFPASHRVLDLAPRPPDVLHLHNLHGGYFDLAALPELSARQPTVVTMHDEWLYTGHCAYSLDSERWLHGLRLVPPSGQLSRAARRRDLGQLEAQGSDLRTLAAACRLPFGHGSSNRAQQSMLAPAIVSACVIPNGVDLELFSPGDRERGTGAGRTASRQQRRRVRGPGARTNPYKDFATLRAALEHALDEPGASRSRSAKGGAEGRIGV